MTGKPGVLLFIHGGVWIVVDFENHKSGCCVASSSAPARWACSSNTLYAGRCSAEAAKEIKELVSSSLAEVDQGVDLVGQTGKALKEIIAKVSKIDKVVSANASGAKGGGQFGGSQQRSDPKWINPRSRTP